MSNHYSYYLKKSISARDLVFDKVKESDKDMLSRVRKAYIRANTGGLILLVIAFVVSSWIFYNFLTAPSTSILYQIVALSIFCAAIVTSAYFFYHIVGAIKGFRRGVILASSREQENKDGKNATYQYLFDIYMEDRDESLMSFPVEPEVFKQAKPGDGVFIVKVGRKVKVLEDPERKAVMDVSTIKSGIS